MKVIVGNVYQPTLEGSSVKITRSASDPVPTCTLNLVDNTSSIAIAAMSELLVLDDQVIANPTVNMLLNPSLNPYTTSWTISNAGNVALSQNTGGGVIMTFSNIGNTLGASLSQTTLPGSVVPGQTYTATVYVQGSSSPTNFNAFVSLSWTNAGGNTVGSTTTFTGPTPVSTSLVRYTVTATAPTGAASAFVGFGATATNATNSGVVTFTQVQLEPNWFPTLSYPLPWCGPSQANCQQLPLGLWIRQYRKFAGFVTKPANSNYRGNVRDVQIDAVGYAWLMGTIFCNDSFTNTADSTIMTTLLNKYLKSNGVNMLNTSQIVQGVTLSNMQSNWDDLRTIFDNLAAQSGFYWTFDYYWNAIYAPPGYYSMPIALIADGSGRPDMTTTFPAYEFSSESDFTQPGSTILVLGSGTNVAEVIDPNVTAQLGIISGYSLPTGTSWMRKVNESTLQSVTDCTNRGMAELLSYDYSRGLYHLKANVELIAGQGIRVTSSTDGLNQTALLLQQVTASWLGTDGTLTDVWEYQADLGATNRAATNIISRIFRATTRGTSAPAISTTTLAVIENIGIVDQIDANSAYAMTVLADSPQAYYRLGEPPGFSITTAYDWSGNGFNGTYTGGFTLGVADAIVNDTNTAITLDGVNGYVALPSGLNPASLSAFSVELWFKPTSLAAGTFHRIVANADAGGSNTGIDVFLDGSFGDVAIKIGNGTTNAQAAGGSLSAGTWYHLVGTYDGSNIRLYINGTLQATTALAGTIGTSASPINIGRNPATTSNYIAGSFDEVAFYFSTLSQARITAHYNKGLGH